MAFLLGSFTNGLFGGARDMFSIANEWEQLKQNRMETQRQQKLLDASNQVGQAMDDVGDQDYSSADDQAPASQARPAGIKRPVDLSTMPTPRFMQGLPDTGGDQDFADGTAPAAARAAAAAPASADQQGTTIPIPPRQSSVANSSAMPTPPQYLAGRRREGSPFGAAPPAPPANPLSAGGDLIGAVAARGGFSPSGNLPVDIYNTVRQAIPTGRDSPTGTPQPRTTAPQYLPPGNVSGPGVQPSAPVMPAIGTPMAMPTSALQPPQTAPGAPSLANGTAGLGAQILQALNPGM